MAGRQQMRRYAWIIALVGCDSVSAPPAPSAVAVIAGNGQTVPAWTVVPVRPAVRVTDASGRGIAEVGVTFAVVGSGSVSGAEATTDASGRAVVGGWTVGEPGPNVLRAIVQGLPAATIVADALPRVPAQIEIVAGDRQIGAAGDVLAVNPQVRVLDQIGDAFEGAPIRFDVTEGQGTAIGAEQGSDSKGTAEVGAWRLGLPGPNALTARVFGRAEMEAVFIADAEARVAAAAHVVSGGGQVGEVTAVLQDELVVRVVDSGGAAVGGHEVTFTPEAGTVGWPPVSGFSSSFTTTTDVGGFARARWRMPTSPGTVWMSATAKGVPQVGFPGTAVGGAAKAMTLVQRYDGHGVPCVPFEQQPAVRLTDAYGNPVAAGSAEVTVDIWRSWNQPLFYELTSHPPLLGTKTIAVGVDGIAAFTDLAIDDDNYDIFHYLRFRSGSLTIEAGREIQMFNFYPDTILIIRQPPATATLNVPISPGPIIGTRNACGRLVSGNTPGEIVLEGSSGGYLGSIHTFGLSGPDRELTNIMVLGSTPGTYRLTFREYLPFGGISTVQPIRSDPIVLDWAH